MRNPQTLQFGLSWRAMHLARQTERRRRRCFRRIGLACACLAPLALLALLA